MFFLNEPSNLTTETIVKTQKNENQNLILDYKPDYKFSVNDFDENNQIVNDKFEFHARMLIDNATDLIKMKIWSQDLGDNADFAQVSIQFNNDPNWTFLIDRMHYGEDNWSEYYLNPNDLKNIKYSQIKTISINFKTGYINKGKVSYKNNKSFNIIKIDKQYKKDIYLENDQNLTLRFEKEVDFYYSGLMRYEYTTLKFEPEKLKQGKNNTKILKLNISNNKPFDRVNIKPYRILNLPISTSKTKPFNIIYNENEQIFELTENTFYDTNIKETIVGFGENSKPGYVIPYEFGKKFFPYIEMDINKYTDIKISWEVNIEKPYFLNNEGMIKLEISNENNDINIPINWINIEENILNEQVDDKYFEKLIDDAINLNK